jgi:hypothetical protein
MSAPFPIDDNLASLIVMNLFPNLLEPQKFLEDEGDDNLSVAQRQADRADAAKLAIKLWSYCDSESPLTETIQNQLRQLHGLLGPKDDDGAASSGGDCGSDNDSGSGSDLSTLSSA